VISNTCTRHWNRTPVIDVVIWRLVYNSNYFLGFINVIYKVLDDVNIIYNILTAYHYKGRHRDTEDPITSLFYGSTRKRTHQNTSIGTQYVSFTFRDRVIEADKWHVHRSSYLILVPSNCIEYRYLPVDKANFNKRLVKLVLHFCTNYFKVFDYLLYTKF